MALTDGAGRLSLDLLRKRAGKPHGWPNSPSKRSRKAIYSQFYRLHGDGGLTGGTYTLEHMLRETGYSRSHFLRAQQALNQQWRRLTKRGSWLITEEQTEEIIKWLQVDHWSKAKRLDCCLWCSTTSSPMHAIGLCLKDYRRYRSVCKGAGIPTRPIDQIGLVMAVGGSIKMLERIERGIALSVEHLAELATVAKKGDTLNE